MARMIKRSKALAVRPLKTGQPTGAALAFQGVRDAIPLLHGSQGCTAFTKVLFVRHFREPIPLQTTAMDPIGTVMGGEENILVGLETLAKNGQVRVIGLVTTGLTESQGTDIPRMVARFRQEHPEYDGTVHVVPVNTPDFSGCLESGFARAVAALIDTLLPQRPTLVEETPEETCINILPGAHLTPGDVDEIKRYSEAFGLTPLVLPDIATALDGHLPELECSPVSTGGITVEEIHKMRKAKATLVLGRSMEEPARAMEKKTHMPVHRLGGLMGMAATDQLVMLLRHLSGRPVPAWIERDRSRLQDAMMDTHFTLSGKRLALSGDPDGLLQWQFLLHEMGMTAPVVVSSTGNHALADSGFDTIKIGDLEDMEDLCRDGTTGVNVDLLLGNSHVATMAKSLDRPMVRSGYPLFDWIGGHTRCRVGYEGTRQSCYELTNAIVHGSDPRLPPYHSIYGSV
ncbi:MAG: nitrogenase iron-molybdenum cofactor biosynthesis protein NifN [Magnetococcales bacterium]|nr:nitrogenase iron-molybdenum cofactor biosynthesis protein NifN [Magnetococcales bacterium]